MDPVRPTISQELAGEMRQAVDDAKTTLAMIGEVRMIAVAPTEVTLYDLTGQRFVLGTHTTPNGYVIEVLEIGDSQ